MTQFSALALLLIVFVAASFAQSYDDVSAEKRAMRNALVRFGRASGGMRNALVRFGKRSPLDEEDFAPESPLQGKRNGAPQPFGKLS
ncbi:SPLDEEDFAPESPLQ-amide [Caenorhabditis elegans]|uniref:Isoform c of FMRFamide-like neuropeptides 11 n=1 Tax=Caenorhabditis elegans TaxID=6239 RepID=Q21156-3|nr:SPLDEEDFAPESPLQ-amide [Caenorhabditis elegans]CCD68562.1 SPLDEEDFAPESPLQ-amide [Caenorhabditis elegans]|eukprot:NP_001024754.1 SPLDEEDFAPESPLQ-amide [Caenorhabditis elegans]